MRLTADINVEIEVGDFVEAADHQQRLETILQSIRAIYPEARMELRERPRRRPTITQRASRRTAPTGAVSAYVDP